HRVPPAQRVPQTRRAVPRGAGPPGGAGRHRAGPGSAVHLALAGDAPGFSPGPWVRRGLGGSSARGGGARAYRRVRRVWGAAVGDYGVIGDVSTIIESTLKQALSVLPNATAELNDLSAPVQPDMAKLTIFLYEIAEDAASRNRPRVRTEPSPD